MPFSLLLDLEMNGTCDGVVYDLSNNTIFDDAEWP